MNIKKIFWMATHLWVSYMLIRSHMYITLVAFMATQVLQGAYLLEESYNDTMEILKDFEKSLAEIMAKRAQRAKDENLQM